MISQNPVSVESEARPGVMRHDRGFISDEPTMVQPGYATFQNVYHRPFWGPVIAGSLFALSIFVLSWYFMLGCHVGVTEAGTLAFGWGAAVWMWVTAAIAFFCGGMIANSTVSGNETGWLRGAALWGLSVPLGLLLYASALHSGLSMNFVPTSSAGATGSITGTAATGTLNFAYLWAAFISLAIGLVFSFIGTASSRSAMRTTTTTNAM